VVGLASLMAIFTQMISARLGVVTGKDLAQCCRDWYPQWTRWPNWLMSEVAIGACDLAEVSRSTTASIVCIPKRYRASSNSTSKPVMMTAHRLKELGQLRQSWEEMDSPKERLCACVQSPEKAQLWRFHWTPLYSPSGW
jgi:hypothetical protein